MYVCLVDCNVTFSARLFLKASFHTVGCPLYSNIRFFHGFKRGLCFLPSLYLLDVLIDPLSFPCVGCGAVPTGLLL